MKKKETDVCTTKRCSKAILFYEVVNDDVSGIVFFATSRVRTRLSSFPSTYYNMQTYERVNE